MRVSIVFLCICFFTFAIYIYSPNPRDESISVIKNFITNIDSKKFEGSLDSIYLKNGKIDLKQIEKFENNLNWLKELIKYGKWDVLENLIGKSHVQNLSKLFEIKTRNIMGFLHKKNWVALTYIDKCGWKIIAFHKALEINDLFLINYVNGKFEYKEIIANNFEKDTFIKKDDIKKDTLSEKSTSIKKDDEIENNSPKDTSTEKIKKNNKCLFLSSIDFDVKPEKELNFNLIYETIEGKKLEPIEGELPYGKYIAKVNYPGYEPIAINFTIPENVEKYELPIFLNALRRKLIFNFRSNHDELIRITPDEVKINGNNYLSGNEIYPGEYKIIAKKKGYKNIEKNLKILASPNPFDLNLIFVAITKKVKFVFSNANTNENIEPDIFKINDIVQNSFIVDMKPSQEVSIFVQKKGFEEIDDNIKISEDLSELIFPIKMSPISPARVSFYIDYKIIPENFSEKAEIIVKNNNEIKKMKETDYLFPGNYKLEIKRSGYENYKKDIVIKKYGNNFQIPLQAKPRKIILYLVSSYDNKEIIPEKVLFNDISLSEDGKIKAGRYKLLIEKDGYENIEEDLFIRASDEEFLINRKMNLVERVIKFEFLDEESNEKLTPEKIIFGDRVINLDENNKFLPQEYSLKASLKGYEEVVKKVNIPLGSSEYRILVFMKKNN